MTFVWLPLGLAVIGWLALRLGRSRWESVTTPAVTAGVLIWILLEGPVIGTPVAWFLAGAALSLAGDVLLLPAVDRPRQSLTAYFLAALACTAGLNTSPFPVNFSTALFALVVILAAQRVHSRIAAARPELRLPSLALSAALSFTVLSGLATLAKDSWPPVPALLAAGGVVLLAIACILFAWDRSVEPLAGSDLRFRMAYQLGQMALVGGVLMNLS
jgi:hypothetical protein